MAFRGGNGGVPLQPEYWNTDLDMEYTGLPEINEKTTEGSHL